MNVKKFWPQLLVRFGPDPFKEIFLCYGNNQAQAPVYDIIYFKENIPTDLRVIQMSEPILIPEKETVSVPVVITPKNIGCGSVLV